MSIFRDKPAFLYAAVALLAVYIVLTLVSFAFLPLEVRKVESFSYLKHIGVVALNIYFLFSKNRALNYLALIVLAVLPFQTYAEIYQQLSAGNATFLGLLRSIDGIRVLTWFVAVVVLASKLLLDRYTAPPVSGGQST